MAINGSVLMSLQKERRKEERKEGKKGGREGGREGGRKEERKGGREGGKERERTRNEDRNHFYKHFYLSIGSVETGGVLFVCFSNAYSSLEGCPQHYCEECAKSNISDK